MIILFQNTHLNYLLCKSNTIFTDYSIEPELPEGLVYNITTGFLSGQTSFLSEEAIHYTLTASNSYGSQQCTFEIEYDCILLSFAS